MPSSRDTPKLSLKVRRKVPEKDREGEGEDAAQLAERLKRENGVDQ
jgi:hypothetical protein